MQEGSDIHKTASTSPHFTPSQKADEAVTADQAQPQTAMGVDSQDDAPPLKKRRTVNAEAAYHVSTKKNEIESLKDQFTNNCRYLTDLRGKREIASNLRKIEEFVANPSRYSAKCGFEIKYVSNSGEETTLLPPQIGIIASRQQELLDALSTRIDEFKEAFVDNGRDQVLNDTIEKTEATVKEVRKKLEFRGIDPSDLYSESSNNGQYELTANLSDWPPSSSFSPSEAKEDGHFVFEVKSPNHQPERNHHERLSAIPRTIYKPVDQQPETTSEDRQSKHELPPSLLADLTKKGKQPDLDTDPTIIPAQTDTTQPLPYRRPTPGMETERTQLRTDIRPGGSFRTEEDAHRWKQGDLPVPPEGSISSEPSRSQISEEEVLTEGAASPSHEVLPLLQSNTPMTPVPSDADLNSPLSSPASVSLSMRGEDTVDNAGVYERRLFNDSAVQRIFEAQKQHQPDRANYTHTEPAGNDIYSHDSFLKVINDEEADLPKIDLFFEGLEGTSDYARNFKVSLTEEFKEYLKESRRDSLDDIADKEVFNILYNTFSRRELQTDIPRDFVMVIDIGEDKWLVNQKDLGDIRALYVPRGATEVKELQVNNTNTGTATQLACEISGKTEVDDEEISKAKQQCAISKLPPRPNAASFLILQGTGSHQLMSDQKLLDLINAPEHNDKDIEEIEDDVCASLKEEIQRIHEAQPLNASKLVALIY